MRTAGDPTTLQETVGAGLRTTFVLCACEAARTQDTESVEIIREESATGQCYCVCAHGLHPAAQTSKRSLGQSACNLCAFHDRHELVSGRDGKADEEAVCAPVH